MSCDCYCSVALPQGAVGWSAMCGRSFFVNFEFGRLGFSCQSACLRFESQSVSRVGTWVIMANEFLYVLTLGFSWPISFCTF